MNWILVHLKNTDRPRWIHFDKVAFIDPEGDPNDKNTLARITMDNGAAMIVRESYQALHHHITTMGQMTHVDADTVRNGDETSG
jgi:hypothetical protein